MANERILVVEDEEDIQELIAYNLKREGYQVEVVPSGEMALKVIRRQTPTLILLDLMLPGLDGLEVCRILRSDSHYKSIPLIIVTAKGEEADVVTGLELGADDYIPKPFSPRVLLARIRAVLRRKKSAPNNREQDLVRIHNLVIHPGRHEVQVGEQTIEMTFTEFNILYLLARRPGWVYTRAQIVDEIRGYDYPVTDRSVDVHIVGLRKKLGDSGFCIETVRGVGYRMKEEQSTEG